MILRLLALARPSSGRLALAVVFGTLALGSGVGLMATSAWLISRAAQHPPVLTLMVAVVAVRAFGVGRGVFRYAERLTGSSGSAVRRAFGGLISTRPWRTWRSGASRRPAVSSPSAGTSRWPAASFLPRILGAWSVP